MPKDSPIRLEMDVISIFVVGEIMNCNVINPKNVELSDGVLEIIAKEERVGDKPCTSGRIKSLGMGGWTYGRFEASIKLPIVK